MKRDSCTCREEFEGECWFCAYGASEKAATRERRNI